MLLRFLNKACMVRTRVGSGTNNEESDNTSARCTCTVEQVENLKAALSVMPMWSAMVMTFLLQSSSFGVLQQPPWTVISAQRDSRYQQRPSQSLRS